MKNEYLLLAWIVVPVITLYLIHILVFPVFVARYISFMHIPLMILCSKGLNSYGAKIKYPFLKILLCLVFIYQLRPYYKDNMKLSAYSRPSGYSYQDWRGLFGRINAEKGDNTLIATLAKGYKYLYFSKAIKYYNNSQEVPQLSPGEMEELIRNKDYDAIFIVYYEPAEAVGSIEGYRLEKKFEQGKIGYFWFKRM